MGYARELLQMLDKYFGGKEIWDDELHLKILIDKAHIIQNPINKFPPRDYPYFSPSSANSCPRELYVKIKGAKRDDEPKQPHQGRWTRCGTNFGDMIQESLLFIEKHDKTAPFVPCKTEQGFPFWEGFAKECVFIEYKGHKFYLFGTLDGKLNHQETGKPVGLEIKTKQTTFAQTGTYKMKEDGSNISADHLKQISCYSIMYDIEDYIIMYGNLSKKSWVLSEEEYEKNPDLRAFDVHITEENRLEVLDNFAYVLECVKNNTPPPLDLEKFNFNSYKKACALDLSNDEFESLKEQVKRVLKSSLPEYIKQSYFDAFDYIKGVRNEQL